MVDSPYPIAILRLPAVLRIRGIGRSSHYTDIKRGLFPRPILLGYRAVGWPEHEVVVLTQARISGLSEDDIRAMVQRLEAARISVLQGGHHG